MPDLTNWFKMFGEEMENWDKDNDGIVQDDGSYHCPDCGKRYVLLPWFIKHCANDHSLLIEKAGIEKKGGFAVIGYYTRLSEFIEPKNPYNFKRVSNSS